MTTTIDLPPVVDLAVDPLLSDVDSARTPLAFEAWRRGILTRLLTGRAADGVPLVVTVPTVWGTPRCARLRRALRVAGVAITFVPRAIAIARSHSDVASAVCIVVEPGPDRTSTGDTSPGRPATWLAHRTVRGTAGWELASTTLLDLDEDWPDKAHADASAIFVGGHPRLRGDIFAWLHQTTGVGRIVGVDDALLTRYGSDPGVAESPLEIADDPVSTPPIHRRRRALVAATCAAVAVALAAVVGVRATEAPPRAWSVEVGRVSLEVPGGWRQSEVTGDAQGTARTVFVHRDDGRRIIVVQTAVRAGSTAESVARSLVNKIAQRGDDAVAEFAPSMRMAGRDVIAYRETPVSGSPIAWYVLVEHDLQVSIGCQAGVAQSVQTECAAAVASASIR